MSTFQNNGETIVKAWCDRYRIHIQTSSGREMSRPLEAFPRLKEATAAQRKEVKIGRFGDDLRWDALDEDIHITSFYEENEPDCNNEIARLFSLFPQLNVSEVARTIGINKSLLAKYIYGIKTPSKQREEQIRKVLNELGQRLIAETDPV